MGFSCPPEPDCWRGNFLEYLDEKGLIEDEYYELLNKQYEEQYE